MQLRMPLIGLPLAALLRQDASFEVASIKPAVPDAAGSSGFMHYDDGAHCACDECGWEVARQRLTWCLRLTGSYCMRTGALLIPLLLMFAQGQGMFAQG